MKVVGFSLWQRAGWKGGGRGGKLKRGASCFKSGNVANQKELYRKGGGRIQRTVNQGMSGTQGGRCSKVAETQRVELCLPRASFAFPEQTLPFRA